jgi:murein DD-endopeptidase MepM/ murein hydrolase activator NlpD
MIYTLSDIFDGNYPVSQIFGADPTYYGQFVIYGVRQLGHEGVDFATPVGVNCRAPFDGIVLRTGYQPDFPNYGNVVVLWDPKQLCAVWFCHLSSWNVDVGNVVKKGTLLGKTGISGNVNGAHLHFGLVPTDANGNRLNQYNGFGGFLNSLSPSVVKWTLGVPTVPPIVQKLDSLKIAVDRLKNEFDSAYNSTANKQQIYDDTIAKVKKISETGTL